MCNGQTISHTGLTTLLRQQRCMTKVLRAGKVGDTFRMIAALGRVPWASRGRAGEHTEGAAACRGDDGREIAAGRRSGVSACAERICRWKPLTLFCQWLPNSERRRRRSGAKRERRLTRAPLLLRSCATSRVVISRISDVASAASRCGTAGPPKTERCRSRRALVALLPHVIAGTRALLRTVICSMTLPTRQPTHTAGTRPGQVNPIAPSGHPCIPVIGFTSPVRGLGVTLRIQLISGRVGQEGHWWAGVNRPQVPL
jgi:hypothetical protein